jgi:aspartyl-tRNA(Asn)/glutamyl-tRNA(Gln) amidotransferase subunit A
MKDLYKLTVKEAAELLDKGEITSVELTKSCLARISEKEPEINAFITVTKDYALKKADQSDEIRQKEGKRSVLEGIPYSLKDAYVTKDVQTTAGSDILKGYIPPYSATVHKKLEEKGGILIGKTNCDPFGFGSSTEHSAYGVTKNPHDVTRVPGGSSGGSGAAVSYGGGIYSIGEDTGGSIRCPASFCGVVGLKPTYGLVSRYGAIAYASSFDTVGPMTKTVKDNALILSEIAGNDPKDATSTNQEIPDYTSFLDNDLKGKTIGIPKEYFGEGLDDQVKEVVEGAIEKYKEMGCKIKEITIPNTKYAIAIYYIIGLSEASSNLARFDGMRYGQIKNGNDWLEIMEKTRGVHFSDEAKRRIMVGSYTLSAGYSDQYYKKAQKVRAQLKKDFLKWFDQVDVILTPTMPVLPFKIGENEDDPLKMWLLDAFTVSINPIGLPGLSVPAGKSKENLPVGMQIISPHYSEGLLYNFGYQYEKIWNMSQ